MAETNRTRVVIVDDEELSRSVLKEFLQDHPDMELVAECRDGFEAVKRISALQPDLVLLDIQMPKLDGFEVLELLEPRPLVVFVTAYDEHALRAFEVHAVDYLLKPVEPERLSEALDRVRSGLAEPSRDDGIDKVIAERRSGRPLERLIVKDGTRVTIIPVDKIDYFEAQDDYVAIHAGGKSHLKQQTLTELAELLDSREFVRIHRSFILNIRRLRRLELYAKDSRLAILQDGKQLLVSRSGYARLKKLL